MALDNKYEIVIAGGGIAGLSAGLAAARLGRRTLVLTGDVLGGQLLPIERIEGYPGFPDGIAGYDLCPMAQEQAIAAGAEIAAGEVSRLERADAAWRIVAAAGPIEAPAVIVATGTTLNSLDVPGAARLAGKGVSHCASCDAPLMRGKPVAVVGGGDSALQEALTLAASAARVTVLVRGRSLAAQASFVARVSANPKIEIRYGAVVTEVRGASVVEAVRLRDIETKAESDLALAGLFVYIGLAPNAAPFAEFLARDGAGRIVTDGALRATAPGVFAAGTVRAGSAGRAAVAAGEGTVAALAADRYIADT